MMLRSTFLRRFVAIFRVHLVSFFADCIFSRFKACVHFVHIRLFGNFYVPPGSFPHHQLFHASDVLMATFCMTSISQLPFSSAKIQKSISKRRIGISTLECFKRNDCAKNWPKIQKVKYFPKILTPIKNFRPCLCVCVCRSISHFASHKGYYEGILCYNLFLGYNPRMIVWNFGARTLLFILSSSKFASFKWNSLFLNVDS